jgi:hypothetical protein
LESISLSRRAGSTVFARLGTAASIVMRMERVPSLPYNVTVSFSARRWIPSSEATGELEAAAFDTVETPRNSMFFSHMISIENSSRLM